MHLDLDYYFTPNSSIMLFDFKLELEAAPRSISKNILYQLNTHRLYVIIAMLSVALGLYSQLTSGLAFGLGSTALYYLYNIWMDISLISFSTDGLDFDLQDVINDLESR